MEAMDTQGRSQVFSGKCIWRVDHVPPDGPTLMCPHKQHISDSIGC